MAVKVIRGVVSGVEMQAFAMVPRVSSQTRLRKNAYKHTEELGSGFQIHRDHDPT